MDSYSKERNLYIDGQKITDLVIPAEVTKVKPYLFLGCTGLKSVTFMGDLQSVDEGAFAGCRIEKIQFNGTCGSIGNIAFVNNNLKNDLVLPGVLLPGVKVRERRKTSVFMLIVPSFPCTRQAPVSSALRSGKAISAKAERSLRDCTCPSFTKRV